MSNEAKPYIVTTKHRGVFFGYSESVDGESIRLTKVRNCIAWSRSIGGVLGLANNGPNDSCRIGAQAPAMTLRGITAVIEVSEKAARAWETAPCVS